MAKDIVLRGETYEDVPGIQMNRSGGGTALFLDSDDIYSLIAPAYDPSQTYSVNDYVVYNTKLYICNTEITTAEQFDPSHWTMTDMATVGKDAEDLYDRKADIDGYFEGLGSGTTDQIVSAKKVHENVPFNFRPTANGLAVGDRVQQTIVGGSVVWNQLQDDGDPSGTNRGDVVRDGHKYTYTVTSLSDSPSFYSNNIRFKNFNKSIPADHYLLGIATITYPRDGKGSLMFVEPGMTYRNGAQYTYYANVPKNTYIFYTVGSGISINKLGFNLYPNETALEIGDEIIIENPMVFDLTMMFPKGIIDVIKSKSTNASRMDMLYKNGFLLKDYYPYTAANTIENVSISAFKRIGFNAYNPETGKAKLIGGKAYQITGTYTALSYSTGETITPDEDGEFTPTYGGELTVTGGNSTDTCIHLVGDGSRGDDYEPYWERSGAISNVSLGGYIRINSSDNFVYDGDIYNPDGTITRKRKRASGNWKKSANLNHVFYLNGQGNKQFGLTALSTTISNLLPTITASSINAMDSMDYGIRTTDIIYAVNKDCSTAAEFNTWATNNGLEVEFELATPVVERATPFSYSFIVDPDGTEEFVDAGNRDFDMPVGHESYYLSDMRGKLEDAPDSPTSDGDYVLRRDEGNNVYATLSNAVVPLIASKAEIDGYYENFGAGRADNLDTAIATRDQIPYNYRTVDLARGSMVKQDIVGGSVVWNQLLLNVASSSTEHNVTFTNNQDGSWTLTGTPDVSNTFKNINYVSGKNIFQLNHVYYMPKGSSVDYIGIWALGATSESIKSTDNNKDAVFKATDIQTSGYLRIQVQNLVGTDIGTVKVIPQLHDLTLMFGPTIANHIYSLEQTEVGTGITKLKSCGFFTEDYYPYTSEPKMEHVKVSKYKSIGFNRFNKETDATVYNGYLNSANGVNKWVYSSDSRSIAFKCLPNTKYNVYLKGVTVPILRAGSTAEETLPTGTGWTIALEKEFTNGSNVSRIDYTTGANAKWLIIQISSSYILTGIDNLCVSFYGDGTRLTDYSAYVEKEYTMDSGEYMGGIPLLDASNNLHFKGDVKSHDGSRTRKYALLDLGTRTWAYDGTRFTTVIPDIVQGSSRNKGRCDKYPISLDSVADSPDKSFIFGTTATSVYIKDSDYTDAATFKAAMSGVYLLYELATPTTETADPFINPQIIDNWGTEEFVDAAYEAGDRDFKMPVGHDSYYPTDLKAKLEASPDAPASDGTYLMKRTNGQNAYVNFTDSIPADPTENGTYVLKVTISNGVATRTWVAET